MITKNAKVKKQQNQQNQSRKKLKVMVAMSGGVDSSVAALLLKQQGYEVIGATMNLWQHDEQSSETACCGLDTINDARRVAAKIGIPHYVFNFKDLFQHQVVNYFIDQYLAGQTPNPCIQCNKKIKFDALLNKAAAMGIDYLATGHYARVQLVDGRFQLMKAKDENKDQAYVLYNLTQAQLARVLFPLGEYAKSEVRQLARDFGLAVADKPESQDLCFVQDGNYAEFMAPYLQKSNSAPLPGNFVDTKGQILGQHQGVHLFTIGQRKGIGLASSKPWYVVAIRPETNEVVLGDEADLLANTLIAEDVNWVGIEDLVKPLTVQAQIRYRGQASEAVIRPVEKRAGAGASGQAEAGRPIRQVTIEFKTPQRAITPGQAVVFWAGNRVVGGGRIAATTSAAAHAS